MTNCGLGKIFFQLSKEDLNNWTIKTNYPFFIFSGKIKTVKFLKMSEENEIFEYYNPDISKGILINIIISQQDLKHKLTF